MALSSKFAKVLDKADPQQSRVQDNVNSVLEPVARYVQATPIMGAPPPAWIYPNFADANWSNALIAGTTPPFLGTTAKLAFHKDALGYVHFKGLVTSATNRASAQLMFTLPSGYAPKDVLFFNCYSTTGTANDDTIVIYPTGAVACGTITAGKSVDLACIIFLAEGGGSGSLGGGSGGGISPHG